MLDFLKSDIKSPLIRNLYSLYEAKNFLQLKKEIEKNLDYLTSEKGIKELKKEIEKNSKASDIAFLWSLFISILKEIKINEQTKKQLIENFDKEKEEKEETKNTYEKNPSKENEQLVLSTIKNLTKGIKKIYEENEKLKKDKEIWYSKIKEYSDIYKLLITENLLTKDSSLKSIEELIKSYKVLNIFLKNMESKNIIIKVNNGFYKINPNIKYPNSKKISQNKEDIKKLKKELTKKDKKITELEKKVKKLEEKIKEIEKNKQQDDIQFKIKILEAKKKYKNNNL